MDPPRNLILHLSRIANCPLDYAESYVNGFDQDLTPSGTLLCRKDRMVEGSGRGTF